MYNSTAKKTIEMKFFWMIELYRRLLETLSSSETKKLKTRLPVGQVSKAVRYKWNSVAKPNSVANEFWGWMEPRSTAG